MGDVALPTPASDGWLVMCPSSRRPLWVAYPLASLCRSSGWWCSPSASSTPSRSACGWGRAAPSTHSSASPAPRLGHSGLLAGACRATTGSSDGIRGLEADLRTQKKEPGGSDRHRKLQLCSHTPPKVAMFAAFWPCRRRRRRRAVARAARPLRRPPKGQVHGDGPLAERPARGARARPPHSGVTLPSLVCRRVSRPPW